MSERSNEQLDALAAAAKRLLDHSVQDLDPKTVMVLQRARRHALDRPSRRRPWLLWAGGAALASMAALALTIWLSPSGGVNHSHLLLLEDLELVQSPENIELSEDLEFYDWLADRPAATS
ncbi:MAG: hypothetical protein OJF47_003147 [Nitrospira sp.]|jgi:type III secretory pathway lipoprotein EscJ|nr:MAG: hypothetical protein OJF47_003147 [Nitrospira sp.]